ncbi:hypothetical protein [Acinetobacter baumannii]
MPVLGWLVLFVWYVLPGTIGDNRFGPNTHPLRARPLQYG